MSSGADAAGLDDDDFAAAAAERPHLVQNVAPPEAAVLVEDLGFADGALRSLPRVEVPSAARPGAARQGRADHSPRAAENAAHAAGDHPDGPR